MTKFEKQNKFHLIEHEDYAVWERIDRVQEYRGCTILTITSHIDTLLGGQPNTRFYRVFHPDGHDSMHSINKRGDNIKSLKKWLDYKYA